MDLTPQKQTFSTVIWQQLSKKSNPIVRTSCSWFVVSITCRSPSVRKVYGSQLGPFIDASHPKIKSGDVDFTPKEMFERYFVEGLRSLLASNPDTMILLVPSVKDILSDHPVMPQCELERELFPDPVGWLSYSSFLTGVRLSLTYRLSASNSSRTHADSPSAALPSPSPLLTSFFTYATRNLFSEARKSNRDHRRRREVRTMFWRIRAGIYCNSGGECKRFERAELYMKCESC